MTRLTRVELRRLFSRRLSLVVTVLAVLLCGLVLYGVWDSAKPLPAAQVAANRAQFEQAHRDWVAHGEQMKQECLANQAEQRQIDPSADFGCNDMEPKLANWGKPQAKFSADMPPVLEAGTYLVAFLAFLLGAGFLAAEFSSGAIGNWLTFEPRRLRVLTSKLGAVAGGVIPGAVAVLAVLTGAVWLIVGHYGDTTGTTGQTWTHLGAMGGRALILVSAAAVAGACIGLLARHTAVALGLAAGYLIVVEGVLGSGFQRAQPWLARANFESWLRHGTTYYLDHCSTDAQGNYQCQALPHTLSFGHSAAYLTALLLVLVLVTALVFRRRDVA